MKKKKVEEKEHPFVTYLRDWLYTVVAVYFELITLTLALAFFIVFAWIPPLTRVTHDILASLECKWIQEWKERNKR